MTFRLAVATIRPANTHIYDLYFFQVFEIEVSISLLTSEIGIMQQNPSHSYLYMMRYILCNVIGHNFQLPVDVYLKTSTNHSCGTNNDYGKFDHKNSSTKSISLIKIQIPIKIQKSDKNPIF